MEYGRHSVLTGETVPLRVVFTDDAGKLVNADAIPDVYIYDSSVDLETVEAELASLTFTSALAGPLAPTSLGTGFYELNYAVPSGAAEGTWHDVWVAQVDGTDSNQIFNFRVDVGADLSIQGLGTNQLVVIELDSQITNLDGDKTLGEDIVLSFSTTFSPLYASPDLIRLEVGTFIDYIPDDTLALMIHWSSLKADFITPPVRCTKRIAFARAQFVLYDTALRALTMPGGRSGFTSSQGISAEGTKKSLGDLMIDRGRSTGSLVPSTSSGVDVETLGHIRDMRDQWFQVLNGGACTNPGQGFSPESAVKGIMDPDRRLSGRLWENPEHYHYPQPTANTKKLRPGRRKAKFGYATYRNRRRWRGDEW